MQTILNDMELDVAELKCLLQAFETTSDPKLAIVAQRNIEHLRQMLNQLQRHLDAYVPGATLEPEAMPAHAETKAEPRVREAVSSAPERQGTPVAPTRTPEPEASDTPILAERIRPARDLRHALSLNDSFRFARELFDGDTARLTDLLSRLSEARTLDEAISLFASKINAPEDNPAVAEFEELLKKYFDR